MISTCCKFLATYTIFKFVTFFDFQLGPEKGVIHLALAAVVNALWDLWAKMEGKVLI